MKKYSIALIAFIALIVAFHYNFFGIYSRSKVKIDLPDRKIENIQTTSQSTQAKREAGNESGLSSPVASCHSHLIKNIQK